jgi:Helicase associated domain
VPHGYEADPSFAEWVHRQRTTYATMLKAKTPNPMLEDRMNKLVELGFNFAVHSDKWMEHWYMLKAFKEKNGNCQVPTLFGDNPKLGRWTHTQRHQRRLLDSGRKSCMTTERIELLDQLGFTWDVRPALEQPRASWAQRLDELKAFFLDEGNFDVPFETHPKLHAWTHEQRTRLAHLAASGKEATRRMGLNRLQALHDLGFTKDTPLSPLCVPPRRPSQIDFVDKLPTLPNCLEHFTLDDEVVAAAEASATLAAAQNESHHANPSLVEAVAEMNDSGDSEASHDQAGDSGASNDVGDSGASNGVTATATDNPAASLYEKEDMDIVVEMEV